MRATLHRFWVLLSLLAFENYSPNTTLNAAVRDFETSYRKYIFMLFLSALIMSEKEAYCPLQQLFFPIFLFHNKINWNCLGKGEHALIMSCLEVCGNSCKGKKSLCGLQSKKSVKAFLWISACLCLHISAGWDCHCRSNLTDKEKRWLRVSPQNVLISNSIVCIPRAQSVFPAVEMPGSQLQWNRKKSSAR